MADADIITTIALSGADDVAKELGGLGKAGEEAFQAIAKAATPLAGLLGEIGRAGSEAFKEIAGAVSPIEGAIAGAAAAFTGLFAAAKEATEAAHSLELLSLQAGASVESISALEGALVALGGSTEGISGAFRRMGTTIAREWDQIKKDVAGAGDTIISDALKVDKAQDSVFKAQQARAKAFGQPGASPMALQREKEKEATTALAEAEHAQAEAEKKQREDQMNSFDAYSKAVDSIIHGQKTFAEAGKDANLSVQNTLKGLIGNAEGAEEALKGFNGNLNSIVGQSPKVLDVFKNLADFIKNSGDATQNQVLMTRLFGRTMGTELLPALSKGSAGIEEQEERIKALGLAITEDMTKPAMEFHETYNRLTDDISRTSVQAGLKLDPAMTDIMKDFASLVEKNRGSIIAFAADIASLVGNVVKLGEAFGTVFGQIGSVLQSANDKIKNFSKSIGDALGTSAFGPWLEKRLDLKPGTLTKPEGAAEEMKTAGVRPETETDKAWRNRQTLQESGTTGLERAKRYGGPGGPAAPAVQPGRMTDEEWRNKQTLQEPGTTGLERAPTIEAPSAIAGRGAGFSPTAGPLAGLVDRMIRSIFEPKQPLFGGAAAPAAEPSILQKLSDLLVSPAKAEEAPTAAAVKPGEAAPALDKVSAPADAAAASLDKLPAPAGSSAEALGKIAPAADAAAAKLQSLAPASDKGTPDKTAAPADATAESLGKISAPADATAESLGKISAPADATAESLGKVSAPADGTASSLEKIAAPADAAAASFEKAGSAADDLAARLNSVPAPSAPEGKAAGGAVGGWGSGKSDSVPIMASKGEFVVTADGSNLGDAISYFGKRHIPGFQEGGVVSDRGVTVDPAERGVYGERQYGSERLKATIEKIRQAQKKQQESKTLEGLQEACDEAVKKFNDFPRVPMSVAGRTPMPGSYEDRYNKAKEAQEKACGAVDEYKQQKHVEMQIAALEREAKSAKQEEDEAEKQRREREKQQQDEEKGRKKRRQQEPSYSYVDTVGAKSIGSEGDIGAAWRQSGNFATGGIVGGCEGDCGSASRADASRTVAKLAQVFSGGGLVNGFVDTIAAIPGYASGGSVNGTSGSSNTLGYHALDIRTNAGNFTARVDEDTMEALRNSSLAGKLSQTGTRPSWFS